jgi:hypothetical protein
MLILLFGVVLNILDWGGCTLDCGEGGRRDSGTARDKSPLALSNTLFLNLFNWWLSWYCGGRALSSGFSD